MKKSPPKLRAWIATGEPWIWLNAAAVGISVLAVSAVLGLIAVRGLAHFWPSDIYQIRFNNPQPPLLGRLVESELIDVAQYREARPGVPLPPALENEPRVERLLVKTGNRQINPPDFRWVYRHEIAAMDTPAELLAVERAEWGNAYGRLSAISLNGERRTVEAVAPVELWQQLRTALNASTPLREHIQFLERNVLGQINYRLEQLRLEERKLDLSGDNAEQQLPSRTGIEAERAALDASYAQEEAKLRLLREQLGSNHFELTTAAGQTIHIDFADFVRAWQPNSMGLTAKLDHYGSSLKAFLTEDPREANTEGGIYPALFGTVLMVLLMSVLVTPFGVIAAIYLREYARQGPLVRVIRIAVNNLAGVPSIVYGVFGLGFFVYFLGGSLDQLFFPEALPAPTLGTPGLLWASLTLALLTLPVVIVSTEEGLTRIPRSVRDGSLALGATKAETLYRVVLPMASPSILTGVILAVARAAGEVAPLMLVGVVKLAPALPVDGNFPFLHLERKFMHLGFHIYDVGFQSPNVEAARPLVYATALLLVLIIIVLNLTAITLRGRLERRYKGLET